MPKSVAAKNAGNTEKVFDGFYGLTVSPDEWDPRIDFVNPIEDDEE